MTRYFAQNTPRAGLEHMMMSVPGFQKRGGGMMILSRFCYKPEDVDCRYCLHYRRRSCQVRTCPYIAERLKSGAIEYLDLILEYFGHIPHAGLHKRIQAVEHWSGPDQAVLHTVSVHLRSRFADRVWDDAPPGYTEIRTQVGVLEVNFCINGRFETSFSMRSHVLLKPGDMAISCYDGLHGTKSESHFPLGYYEGLCLEIDPAAAGHWIRLNAPAFPIDFTALKQNLLGSKWYMVGPAGLRCEHVFRELYESASYAERGFLQLKVLELMLLLGRIPQERAADPYCSAEQTALAHHLRDHLLTNREGYVSLAQLAAEHAISVSHLQKLFKQTYGMPVYHYIKEYRLEQAAVELVRSRKPITEIAQHAGYDNASKFSESFKKRYGKTPSRYRADKTNAAKRSIETKTE